MTKLRVLENPQEGLAHLRSLIDALEPSSRADVGAYLVGLLTMDIPPSIPAPSGAALDFFRTAKHHFIKEAPALPVPSQVVRQVALQILRQKPVSGPDRALVAAVALYHDGKTVVNARRIKAENDEAESEYIGNISNAITPNKKDGRLEEAAPPDDEEKGSHQFYRVTPTGFAFFQVLAERWKAKASEIELAAS